MLFFRVMREAKQALSTLCVKIAMEQQESEPEAPVNVSIAETQFQAERLVDKINMKKL